MDKLGRKSPFQLIFLYKERAPKMNEVMIIIPWMEYDIPQAARYLTNKYAQQFIAKMHFKDFGSYFATFSKSYVIAVIGWMTHSAYSYAYSYAYKMFFFI